jgi:hypothetical protein
MSTRFQGAKTSIEEVKKAAKARVLAEAELEGTYSR